MHSDDYICPVCGWNELELPPRDASGAYSHEICPCCGTQFGYHDVARPHAELRTAWVKQGMRWQSSVTPPPAGWDPVEQLRRAGFPVA